ncbi:AAA family ATPase [candidate division WOR-3 bacterium]|nr:AAA family ATPase [candidate division WOR-3 bacterium]
MKSQDRQEVFASLIGFLPQKVLSSRFVDTRRRIYEILDAALLFADISGFTAMSEKLTALGREGSEEVTKIINGYFRPLIDIIIDWGGDIYRFGGDAIFSVFPQQHILPAGARALYAARQALEYVGKNRSVRTRTGTFKIDMHVGITRGPVFYKDLKSDFFIGGDTAFNLMALVDRASGGEIVVDAGVREETENERFRHIEKQAWKYLGVKSGYCVPSRPKKTIIGGAIPSAVVEEKIVDLSAYVPPWLYKRLEMKPVFDQKDGEHRKVAVAFAHFAGIPYDKDPRQAAGQLDKIYEAFTTTISAYDGWLNKIDLYKESARVLVVFGFPLAHEDCEQRAALFAHDIMNHPVLKGIALRIGLNAGFVFAVPVGSEFRREYTVMGDTVNLAARLAAKAPCQRIIASGPIVDSTYALFHYVSKGKKEFKGKKDRVVIYEQGEKKQLDKKILSRWISESSQLVGRKKELQAFQFVITNVKKSTGRICGITGEAGMGKSRLAQEFMAMLEPARFHVLTGACVSYGRSFSYHPWIVLLNEFFGILPSDPPAAQKKKIQQVVKRVNNKLVDWLPIIGEVLGLPFPESKLTKFLDAKIRKQRFFDIVFDFIKYKAQRSPVCILLEDVHWADSVSMELINYIGRNIGEMKVLVLLVYRPLKNKEEFREKAYFSEIVVRELTRNETAQLTGSLLNIKSLPDGFRGLVIEKSQGNPFYVEEIVKSFIEQGLVFEDTNGKWKFSGELKTIRIPDTVEGVILSRIDRLDIKDRDVLQTASVLGREFDEFILNGIYHDTGGLKRSLNNLQLLDLLGSEKQQGEVHYIFKHVLTKEVAYDTLSFAKKRELHCKTGTFIESTLKTRKEEFLGLLSHHFYHGLDYEKALLYSVEAGEKAKKVYANEEAIEFFTRAIDSYEKLEGPIPTKAKTMSKKS